MDKFNILMYMITVFYILEYFFMRGIYAPKPVESDPYWRAIYGVDEFSPEHIRERKREEEKQVIEMNDSIQKFETPTMESVLEPFPESLEVSNDEEVDDIVKQLQKEFGGDKFSLFGEKEESNYLDVEELHFIDNQELPNSMISNNMKGPQKWFVTVVGKEGEYLHVSDGMKKWVHVGEKARTIYINDTLFLTVQVENGKINVLDLVVMS